MFYRDDGTRRANDEPHKKSHVMPKRGLMSVLQRTPLVADHFSASVATSRDRFVEVVEVNHSC